jgi:hypothetical protein
MATDSDFLVVMDPNSKELSHQSGWEVFGRSLLTINVIGTYVCNKTSLNLIRMQHLMKNRMS